MPPRIARLPVDSRGYPVPKFASWHDGVPDFRLADTAWVRRAFAENRCWVCGDTLGQYKAFVIGPMCMVNRTTAEPPCHLECAEYSVRACPFLAFPQRKRNMDDLPADRIAPPGLTLERNPGVSLIWVCKTYKLARAHGGNKGVLVTLGEATAKHWYRRGRPATLPEVLDAIETGLPALREIARVHDGPEGVRELEDLIAATFKAIREEPRWQESC